MQGPSRQAGPDGSPCRHRSLKMASTLSSAGGRGKRVSRRLDSSAQPRTTLRGAERGAPPWTQALQVVVKPLPECGTEQQLYGFVRRQLPFGSGREREKALGRWASPSARGQVAPAFPPSHPLCEPRGAVPETFLVKRRIDTRRVRDSPPRPLGLLLPHGRALPAGSALRPAF